MCKNEICFPGASFAIKLINTQQQQMASDMDERTWDTAELRQQIVNCDVEAQSETARDAT